MHLEPKAFHEKLGGPNSVVIDVRNYYEVWDPHPLFPITPAISVVYQLYMHPFSNRGTTHHIFLSESLSVPSSSLFSPRELLYIVTHSYLLTRTLKAF